MGVGGSGGVVAFMVRTRPASDCADWECCLAGGRAADRNTTPAAWWYFWCGWWYTQRDGGADDGGFRLRGSAPKGWVWPQRLSRVFTASSGSRAVGRAAGVYCCKSARCWWGNSSGYIGMKAGIGACGAAAGTGVGRTPRFGGHVDGCLLQLCNDVGRALVQMCEDGYRRTSTQHAAFVGWIGGWRLLQLSAPQAHLKVCSEAEIEVGSLGSVVGVATWRWKRGRCGQCGCGRMAGCTWVPHVLQSVLVNESINCSGISMPW